MKRAMGGLAMAGFAMTGLLWVGGAMAGQAQQDHEHGAAAAGATAGARTGAGEQSMMQRHMKMMEQHEAKVKMLLDQMDKNVARMQGERDARTLEAEVTEQAGLLKELKAEMASHESMMKEMMTGMMGGGMEKMNGAKK